MLLALTSKTTISIDGIVFGTTKGVDRKRTVDRNGIERVGHLVPNMNENEGSVIDEAMGAPDDSELGALGLKYMDRKNISFIANAVVARIGFDKSLSGDEIVVVWTETNPTRGEAVGRDNSPDNFNNTANRLPLTAVDRSIAGKLMKSLGISSGSYWPSSSLPLTTGATVRSTGAEM